MFLSKNFYIVSYLTLLAISIYSPRFEVLDKMAIQYFLISISNTLALIFFPLYFKSNLLLKQYRHPLFLFMMGYLTMSILSMIKSINIIESIVEIGQIITFIITLYLLLILVYERLIKINHLLVLMTITLLIDIFLSLSAYLPFVTNDLLYSFDDNWRLVGQYGNRNILATTIAFRIPFVILLALRLGKGFWYFIFSLINIIALFNISLLSSRATYLAIILSLIFICVIILYRIIKLRELKLSLKSPIIILYILPCIIAYFMSTQAINPEAGENVVSRISTITTQNDTSKNTRLRYYSQSIDHISKNPFLGAGIGNWKILSIKYDSENIQNYIIPYNAHNDILEATAETGIIGGLSFLMFFLFIFYYLFKYVKSTVLLQDKFIYGIVLFLPFICYFIDLNLNFPSSRPANQFFLLIYICTIICSKQELNENK